MLIPVDPAPLAGRDGDHAWLVNQLLPQSRVVVMGQPGVGKTALAATVARDPVLTARFPDGVLWLSFGENPNLFSELDGYRRGLGQELSRFNDIAQLTAFLRAFLKVKRVLLVADDVWSAQDLEPLLVGGDGSALLVTTRSMDVARHLDPTPSIVVHPLARAASLDLLRNLVPEGAGERESREQLVDLLQGLPLALCIAGRMMRYHHVHDLLACARAFLSHLAELHDQQRQWQTLSRVLSPGFFALLLVATSHMDRTTRRCFATLGVFAPKPATFDAAAIRHMSEVDDPREAIGILVEYGLLEVAPHDRYWIHGLLVRYANTLLIEGTNENL